MTAADGGRLGLADYRRAVSDLYAPVRAGDDHQRRWRVWRAARDELLASHGQSPVPVERRTTFRGMPFFPYDPTWRLRGQVERVSEQQLVLHADDGSTTSFVRFARVVARRGELEIALAAFWLEGYGGGVFLPFRDATNGDETYGGGRYLLDGAKGADLGGSGEELVLDFNFSYHPSCAHDPRWACPLSPPENTLSWRVEAGERLPDSP